MKRKFFLFIVSSVLAGIMFTSCCSNNASAPTGKTFKNDTSGCSLTVPEDWSMKELKQGELGPHIFLVQFISDDFDSNIVFLAQGNSMNLTAQEAIDIDISNMKANSYVEFELTDKGPAVLKNYNAYQMIDKFSQKGIIFRQKRIYIVNDNYFYGIILNSKTEEAFNEDLIVFDNILNSLDITK